MREVLKGLVLFVLDWLLVILFYESSILVSIGNILQNVLKTSTIPTISYFVDIITIWLISYFVNNKLFRAEIKTFIIVQILFGVSAVVLLTMIFEAVARGILMNA